MQEHEIYMKQCLDIGEKAMLKGNPPVGALLVMNNTIVGTGMEATALDGDITRHAEIEAIRDAIKQVGKEALRNTILYTTHEPCFMCSYIIRQYKIRMLVFATEVPHIGGVSSNFNIIESKNIPIWGTPPRVISGVLKKEAKALSKIYESRKSKKNN